LPPSPLRSLLLRNLTPATGASGPHDFAVRVSRARQSQLSRPPHPAPTSVTIAIRPSSKARDGDNTQVIWVERKSKYFCKWGWTQHRVICPIGRTHRCSRHPEERRLRRVSKDGVQRCACGYPSRRARKSAHLTGERNCVHPGDDGGVCGHDAPIVEARRWYDA